MRYLPIGNSGGKIQMATLNRHPAIPGLCGKDVGLSVIQVLQSTLPFTFYRMA